MIINAAENRFLRGDYAPITEEQTIFDLPVTGQIPADLNGRYLRNGPNPLFADGRNYHFFSGDAMIHGISLREGHAEWYRSRWVRHVNVSRMRGEPPRKALVFGGMDQPPNTHVIGHAGQTLALVEAGTHPYALTEELETIGTTDFAGTLPGGFTAHPHIDPQTGDMHAVTYFPGMPVVQHVVVNPAGKVVRAESVFTPHMPMVHDFAMTENFVLIFDLQAGFSREAAMAGYSLPYAWDESYQPRVGLLPIGGRGEDVRWFDVPSFWTFHPMNAYETDGKVICDIVSTPKVGAGQPGAIDHQGLPSLDRLTLDLATGSATLARLDDRPQEFPRINERMTGRYNRYGYTMSARIFIESQATADELKRMEAVSNHILKFDHARQTCEERDLPEHATVGEPVFVEAAGAVNEDDGYLMFTEFNPDRDATDLVILDARAIKDQALARIHLPIRVPFGFHGSFVPYAH